jgi:CTP:molybdopterin cytidylyltransferase MocA
VDVLRGGGCSEVLVVLGAAADEAALLVADLPAVSVVVAHDHQQGLSASLRTGLDRLAAADASAAVVTLVDLPDLHAGVVARLLDRLGTEPGVLGRAAFEGRPGHPVLLGRRHWAAVAAELRGDTGARAYLDRLGAALVECGDLARGEDVDTAS